VGGRLLDDQTMKKKMHPNQPAADQFWRFHWRGCTFAETKLLEP